MLDTAQAAHPGVEFGIALSLANALLLPKDSNKLWRKDADGRQNYYRGHVYRDCLVNGIPGEEPAPIDFLVIVSPVYGTSPEAEQAVAYYGDLRSGALDGSDIVGLTDVTAALFGLADDAPEEQIEAVADALALVITRLHRILTPAQLTRETGDALEHHVSGQLAIAQLDAVRRARSRLRL